MPSEYSHAIALTVGPSLKTFHGAILYQKVQITEHGILGHPIDFNLPALFHPWQSFHVLNFSQM